MTGLHWNLLIEMNIAPFNVASFDIECNSSTGKFPNANIIGDACFQIAVSLCKFGEDEPFEKVCLCYKKTEGDWCYKLWYWKRDSSKLFSRMVQKKDIDILTGWNIFGFDFQYIHTRAHLVGCNPNFFKLGKLKDQVCEISIKKLSSSALGDNTLKLLPMSGRFILIYSMKSRRDTNLIRIV